MGAGLNVNDLKLISQLNGNRVTTVSINEKGIFYFQVTVTSKDYIFKNGNCHITYEDVKVDSPFALNTQNKTNYKMAVWENDFIASSGYVHSFNLSINLKYLEGDS